MVTRAEIRKIFAQATEDIARCITVFSGRHIDELYESMPAATIMFDALEVTHDMSDNLRFTGNVIVTVFLQDDDDTLDLYLDDIIVSTLSRMRTQLPGTGCLLTSITYDRDVDPGLSMGQLNWLVEFNG